jgi:hypothetical protein
MCVLPLSFEAQGVKGDGQEHGIDENDPSKKPHIKSGILIGFSIPVGQLGLIAQPFQIQTNDPGRD